MMGFPRSTVVEEEADRAGIRDGSTSPTMTVAGRSDIGVARSNSSIRGRLRGHVYRREASVHTFVVADQREARSTVLHTGVIACWSTGHQLRGAVRRHSYNEATAATVAGARHRRRPCPRAQVRTVSAAQNSATAEAQTAGTAQLTSGRTWLGSMAARDDAYPADPMVVIDSTTRRTVTNPAARRHRRGDRRATVNPRTKANTEGVHSANHSSIDIPEWKPRMAAAWSANHNRIKPRAMPNVGGITRDSASRRRCRGAAVTCNHSRATDLSPMRTPRKHHTIGDQMASAAARIRCAAAALPHHSSRVATKAPNPASATNMALAAADRNEAASNSLLTS